MSSGVRVREYRRTCEVLEDLPVSRTAIEVRIAMPADLEQVVALCLEARLETGMTYSAGDAILVAGQLERLMGEPTAVVVSGWVKSRLAGMAVIRIPAPNPFLLSQDLQLDSLYVASRWRRHGVGEALLAKVVVLAEENEAESIVSTSPTPERIALRFMARRGFIARDPHRAVTLTTLRRMLGSSMELDRRSLTREEIIARRRRQGKDASPAGWVDSERDRPGQRGSEIYAQARRAEAIRRSA